MGDERDSISTNPKLLEMARQAAQGEEIRETLKFDPITVFNEEYSKIVDPKYDMVGRDQAWASFGKIAETSGKVVGHITESEFRRMASSLAYHLQGRNLHTAEGAAFAKSDAHKATAFSDIAERLKIDEMRLSLSFNPITGVVRATDPNEEKDGSKMGEFLKTLGGQGIVLEGENALDMLKTILGGKKR